MKKYELTGYQDMNHTFYLIRNTETQEYFAGYDFMGSQEWVENITDGYEMSEHEALAILKDLESADADDQPAEKGFFWSDEIKALDDAITHTLNCLAECHTEKERKFFKDQYKRFEARRAELANDWLAIW